MTKRLIIINPVSGAAKAISIFENLAHLFSGENLSKVISTEAGHIYNIAHTADFSAIDSVVIVGGDGTLHEFINGMMDRPDGAKVPVGLIPAGTGNSLMHDIDGLHPHKAVEKILKGSTFKMDVAKLIYGSKHVFAFNVIGWGIPSTVNQKSENLKMFGSQRYNIASFLEIIRNPNWPLKLTVGSEVIEGNYSFFMACNTIHTGKGMKMAPDASLIDGKFDLVLLKKASRIKLVNLFSKIFKGTHISHPIVVYKQASTFSISEQVPSVLIVDGQIVGSTPFNAEVIPGAIEVFG